MSQALATALTSLPQPPIHVGSRDNIGLATAQGGLMALALADGHDWILLLDQDSVPHAEALPRLLAAAKIRGAALAVGRNIDSALPDAPPAWVVSLSGTDLVVLRTTEETAIIDDLLLAPASGSLLRADAVRRAGFPDPNYLIDWVDFDYCLRLRQLGGKLVGVPGARIGHRLGSSHAVRLPLSRRRILATHHPAWRRRLQARNALWTLRHHGATFPVLRLWTWRLLLATAVKILLYETGRGEKLAAFAQGLWQSRRRQGRAIGRDTQPSGSD